MPWRRAERGAVREHAAGPRLGLAPDADPGLYQTGSTTHPGGSISAGPGRNAAAVMLKDFGTSLEKVVAGKRDKARAVAAVSD